MPDLADGESTTMQGSGSKPYLLKNTGGVYSCSCPAWRNQSTPIERRTCKHLRKLRGEAAEAARVATDDAPLPAPAAERAEGAPVLLAESWDSAADLTGWWMSEKLDGVRAWWDGQQLLSRLGNVLHAPDWFVAGLPPVPLDGELWMERKAFQRTVSVVRRQDRSDAWREVRLLLFDAPPPPAASKSASPGWPTAPPPGATPTSAPTRTSAAAAPTTSAPSSPASRPSAARG